MKPRFLILAFVLLMASPVLAQIDPRSPGIRQGQQADAQAQKDIPPPPKPALRVDLDKLSSEAEELATIAKTIPTDVDNMQKGVVASDMVEKLKRIEKLAKQLRNGVGR